MAGDEQVVSRALRGARAVICPGKLGALPRVAAEQRVEHIVLLSSAGRCYHCSTFVARMLSLHVWLDLIRSW